MSEEREPYKAVAERFMAAADAANAENERLRAALKALYDATAYMKMLGPPSRSGPNQSKQLRDARVVALRVLGGAAAVEGETT